MRKTDTQLKLEDAITQRTLASKHIADEAIFRSCINALISHARSVTMLMERESNAHPKVLQWYKDRMAVLGKEPLMRFFNDQRIQTIHRGVIKPGTRSVKVQEYTTESGIVVVPDDLRAEVWEFENIKKYIPDDNGNVGRLCDQYVFELSRLLLEWLKVREDNGLKS